MEERRRDLQQQIQAFSHDQIRDLLLKSAMAHHPTAESVDNLSQEIKAAKLALPPKDFSRHAEDVRGMLEHNYSPRGKLGGSHLASVVGREIADEVLKIVKK